MNLLGKAMDPAFWAEVKVKDCFQKFRDDLFRMWDETCENRVITELKYSDFRRFVNDGNRSVYESQYFARRRAMDCSCLLSLIYPEEEKYLIRLQDEIFAVCNEYTWCLPAHQTELGKNNNCHLDLFATETGFALAEIYTMLGDRMEPLITDRIRVEFNRRIVEPFRANYYGWENGHNNWTAVCCGSVGCAMMLLRPDLMRIFEPRFDTVMMRYLASFKDDGMCEEGYGYWHYGFGFFTVYADMIRTYTEGRQDFFKLEKVKAISTFIQKMYLTERCTVSFSDGGRSGTYHLGLLHYLKDQYPDDVKVYSPEYSYNYDGCGRFCLQLRSATWLNEEYFNHPSGAETSSECFAKDTQWFIRRTPAYGFAAKGGNNGESHNHNDVGTFIFAKSGRQMITDLGSAPYTRQYFAPDTRYVMYIECSGLGHNLPTFGDITEKEGSQYKASDVKFENGVFSLDIAGAYPTENLKSAKRTFSFTDTAVTLKDAFDWQGDGEITERIVTLVEPKLEDGKVVCDEAEVTYPKEKVKSVETHAETRGEKTVCYITVFTLKDGVKDFELTMK